MVLSDILPSIRQLSIIEKLKLIRILAEDLEAAREVDSANELLQQLASTEAVVWSPQTDSASVQALSDLLIAAKAASNA